MVAPELTKHESKPTVVLLMGPTASGKTGLAMELVKRLPMEIVSVDSAMVYRGMDIGTAKPTAEELAQAPHRMIDTCDPAEAFSVAQFCEQAQAEIGSIIAAGNTPLLVGGTMMYFKALLDGLADMPATDPQLRATIAAESEAKGWPALHAELAEVDPDYAASLHPNHCQRISRALEVYRSSGQTMTALRQEQTQQSWLCQNYQVQQWALVPEDRGELHKNIEWRFDQMLEQGFVAEVQTLMDRGDLHEDLPAIRSVGYRQMWRYLNGSGNAGLQGENNYSDMRAAAIAATRQLAKRQLTWLRSWSSSWPELVQFPADTKNNQKNLELALNFLSKAPH